MEKNGNVLDLNMNQLKDGFHFNDQIDDYIIFECNALFNEVFECNESFEKFRVKHLENPYVIESPICFYVEQGHIVGMNAFMGMIFKSGQNRKLIAQSCDTAVASSQRGKGVFSKIVKGFEESTNDADFIVGIPNNNSLHGFLKMGFISVAKLTTMAKVDANLITCHRMEKNEYIKVFEECSFTEDDLNKINSGIETGIFRTNEYFNYKIKNIKEDCRISCIYKDDRLMGYLIYHFTVKNRIRVITIDDWYVEKSENDTRVFKLLIKSVKSGINILKVPMVNIKSADYSFLTKCGFFDFKKRKKQNYESFVVSSSEFNAHVDWEKLIVRYIDSDTILN